MSSSVGVFVCLFVVRLLFIVIGRSVRSVGRPRVQAEAQCVARS